MKLLVNKERFALALVNSNHTRASLAQCLGFSYAGLWRRLTGRSIWSYPEVHLLAELLEVPELWLTEVRKEAVANLHHKDAFQSDLLSILERRRGAAFAEGSAGAPIGCNSSGNRQ